MKDSQLIALGICIGSSLYMLIVLPSYNNNLKMLFIVLTVLLSSIYYDKGKLL